MTMFDPIADMLTRIRNGVSAKHDTVRMPSSKIKVAIAKVLKEEGFIKDFEIGQEGPRSMLKIDLSYTGARSRCLRHQAREQAGPAHLRAEAGDPRVLGGLGVAILSTPEGVMTGQHARQKSIGGEVLYTVW